jgi:DNA-binding response OmpR family regulator
MSRGTVFVVDDDADTGETVRDVLVAEGYEVVIARDGVELLLRLHSHADDGPRVALVDWAMPGMSGEEVLAEIRADPSLCETPVIIFSAARPPRVVGADAQVDKPFSLDALLSTVERTLRRSPATFSSKPGATAP